MRFITSVVGAVIGTQHERMFGPRLQIVQREGVAVFRRQFGIAERHDGCVARVLERVELSAHGRRSLRV